MAFPYKWSATIRVRRARYKWLCRQFVFSKGYHHLPDKHGTRMLRLYNTDRNSIAYTLLELRGLEEPYDCKFPGGMHAYGRVQPDGLYVAVVPTEQANPLAHLSWEHQNRLWCEAQTRKLLKPGG